MPEFTPVLRSRALTVAIVARRLGVAEATVYRAVRRGEMPAIRVGRSIRIPEYALEPRGNTE